MSFIVAQSRAPPCLHQDQLPVLHPVRLIRIRPLPPLEVLDAGVAVPLGDAAAWSVTRSPAPFAVTGDGAFRSSSRTLVDGPRA
jgi:hypothetical protein